MLPTATVRTRHFHWERARHLHFASAVDPHQVNPPNTAECAAPEQLAGAFPVGCAVAPYLTYLNMLST